MNNFEKIKAMTIEEMADMLRLIVDCEECPASQRYCAYNKCKESWGNWLQAESEE